MEDGQAVETAESTDNTEAFKEATKENRKKIFEAVLDRAKGVYRQHILEEMAGGWDKAHQAGAVETIIDQEAAVANSPYFEDNFPNDSTTPKEIKQTYHFATGVWNTSAREHFFTAVLRNGSREDEVEQLEVANKAKEALANAFMSGKLNGPKLPSQFTLYQAQQAGEFESEQAIYDRFHPKSSEKTT